MLAAAIVALIFMYVVLAAKMPKVAILTVALAAFGGFVLSCDESDEIGAVLSLLMPLTTLMALAILSPRDGKNWPRKAAIWTLRIIAALPVLAVAGVLWPLTVLLHRFYRDFHAMFLHRAACKGGICRFDDRCVHASEPALGYGT